MVVSLPEFVTSQLGEEAHDLIDAALRQSALRGQDELGAEHLLLALLQHAGACKTLGALGLSVAEVFNAIGMPETAVSAPSTASPTVLPSFRNAFMNAASECERRGGQLIEAEDILFGLMYMSAGLPGRVFLKFGLEPESARAALA